MADPIGTVSGLASGIQWRDMIDQIMAMETRRQLDPLTAQRTAAQARITSWTSYQGRIAKLAEAAKALRDGTAFDAFQATVGAGASGRALVAASAAAGATPGSYKVEVLALARAEKLSGAVVASASAPLGVAGDFTINGRTVSVAAADTLASLRDKINALNTGGAPSRVGATILSTGGAQRLVLTSDDAGEAGITLADGATGALRSLGFVDTRSKGFSSITASIATMLGVTMPAPSTIKIGGKVIPVDLSVDSLATIAARLQAEGVSASTVAEQNGGTTRHRLVVGGNAEAVAGDQASADAIALLGFAAGGRSSVAQVVATESALADAATGLAATAATKLTDLQVNGAPAGIQAGDAFNVRGTRGDGTPVSVGLTVDAADTVASLLAKINDATAGFGAGTRTAAATIGTDGRIRLTDGAGGDSRLAMSFDVNRADGTTASLGRLVTETTGRQREVVDGSDARVNIDGVLVQRGGNTIADALPGVTLTLQQAEPGTVVDLTVARDVAAVTGAVQKFATAYNDVLEFVKKETAQGAPLAFSGSLRSSASALTNVLLTEVAGLSGTPYSRGALVGVSLSKTGVLEVDAEKLKGVLLSNPGDLKALFGTGGSVTDPALQYLAAGAQTVAGRYAVNVTAPATRASAAGAGFAGTYATPGAADTLTVSAAGGAPLASVALAAGDTMDAIVARLNAAFAAQSVGAVASKSAGGQLLLTGTGYGSAAGFEVAYAAGDAGSDPAAQLGLAAGSYAGADVQGTIGGLPASGVGQILTGDAGGATEGLSVRYTGAGGAAGDVAYVLGLGGMMTRALDLVTRPGDGLVAGQVSSLERSVASLASRAGDVQARLDLRRESLTAQFQRMEAALSRIQAQGNWLTSQIKALQASASGR